MTDINIRPLFLVTSSLLRFVHELLLDDLVKFEADIHHLQILQDLGVRTMKLMTNNPAKYIGLKGYGLSVVGRVPLLTPITKENKRYLETKRLKMGHIYNSEFNGQLTGLAETTSSDEANQAS